MFIAPNQIKAARDLLLMSQEELAVAAGVSARTVTKAESMHGPNQSEFVSYESLQKIRKTLESRNIKFLGTKGVTILEVSQAKAFEGEDGPFIFFDDVLEAAKNHNEIFAVFDTADTLARSLGVVNFNDLRRLEEISRVATVKLLLTNAEKSVLDIPFFQVKQTTRFPFSYQSRIFCGKLHATIQMLDGRHFSYYETNSLELAAAGQNDFLSAWATSTPIAEMKPVKKKARA